MCKILKSIAYLQKTNEIVEVDKIDYLDGVVLSGSKTFRFCDIVLLRCTGMTAFASYRNNDTLIYDGDLVEIDFGLCRPVHLIECDSYGNFEVQGLDLEVIKNHTKIIGNKYLQK